jgi:hypothetical protein
MLTQLGANGGGIVICHQGGTKYVQLPGAADEKQAPKKDCPICSGQAALHFGVLQEPLLHIAPAALGRSEVDEIYLELVVDHRPLTILNRGPPLLA